MGFLAPWFLGGLFAASIPLYVHLLKQHRSTPVKFSSLMFFERRTQSSVKQRRLKYFALLAMRLGIILLLALMFANPFVWRPATASGGRKLLVIAVDNSFSMRAGNRLSDAKQGALDALSNFRSGDRGQVVAFASGVQLLTPPVEDLSQLRAAIQSVQPSDSHSSYGELARTIRGMAATGAPPVEAHVFSDMQASSLPTPFSELAVAQSTKLVLHPLAKQREPNFFVESVSAPHSVFQAKKTRIQAVVAGSGTEATELTASVNLNGRSVESKRVKLPANGRTTVEFYLPDATYGANRGEVRIEPRDKLAADDSFPFALERKEASRVLFVHESRQGRGSGYFRAAVESMPDAGFAVDDITTEAVGNVAPEKYSFIVLSDAGTLPRSFENSLTDYVKKGGSVLIALGPSAAARGQVPVAGLTIVESRYAGRDAERFQSVANVDETHPATSRVNRFDEVKFYQVVKVTPGKSRVVARLGDNTPLVMEARVGEGRALVFASTFDNISNDLPLHASFLPFIEQSALYLSGSESAGLDYAVDSFLELRGTKDSKSSVDVSDPSGKRALSLKESASAQAFRLTQAGFYEVRRGNGRHELLAVHPERRESDLSIIPQETLTLWQNTGQVPEGSGTGSDPNRKQYGLWWYFALALLGLSVVESLFASRYLMSEVEPVVRKKAA